MKNQEQQLTLPGVDVINSQEIHGLAWNTANHRWGAWSGFESPVIFICQNKPSDMGYGWDKEHAIKDFCSK